MKYRAKSDWRELIVLGRTGEPPGRVTLRWDVTRCGQPVLRQFADTDPGIKMAELHLDEPIIELSDADLAEGDQTQVRPNPTGPSAGPSSDR